MLLFVALFLAVSGLPDGLELPVDGATDISIYPDFLWSGAPVADYQIEIAEDKNFQRIVVAGETEIARYVPAASPLTAGVEYFWRVRSAGGVWSFARSFTVADFYRRVFEISSTNSVEDARRIFAEANAGAPATVRLTGDVRWGTDDAEIFPLNGYANVLFDGNGKHITVTNPANRLFHVQNSTNLIFSNFSVDYDPLPYVLCEVTGLNAVLNQLIVRTVSNAANPCLEINNPKMLAAERQHMRLLDKNNPGAPAYGAETYIHQGSRQEYSHSYLSNNILFHVIQLKSNKYSTDDFAVGDLMLRVARGGSMNTLRVALSRNICVDRVTVFSSPSQFVSCIDGSGFIVINCTNELKEGRYCSVTADSVYVRRNEIGPWVENCRFVANGDDCMNFHSVGAPVISKINDHVLTLTNRASANRMSLGDEVAIWNPEQGVVAPVYTTVTSCNPSTRQVGFADPVGAIHENTVVVNLTKNNRRFYVKNNIIQNNARIGVLLSSQDGVISGNTFERCPSSAVYIGNDPLEGLIAKNILISGNVIKACGYTGTFFSRHDAAITMNAYAANWTEINQRFHSNIRIENNRIESWESGVVKAKGSVNVSVSGTEISAGGMTGFRGTATNDIFIVGNCDHISFAGTSISDSRSYDLFLRDEGNATGIRNDDE